jgi:sterol-4alpha-carboxylate 3-dehydrogenase (decarboxylating)
LLARRAVRLTTMERTICIDKIKRRLGYTPKISIREGWMKALEWTLKEQRPKET